MNFWYDLKYFLIYLSFRCKCVDFLKTGFYKYLTERERERGKEREREMRKRERRRDRESHEKRP